MNKIDGAVEEGTAMGVNTPEGVFRCDDGVAYDVLVDAVAKLGGKAELR
jgi:hypothetical protein